MRGEKGNPDLLTERLELPREAFGSLLVTAVGRDRVLIENHRGIVRYGESCLLVKSREGSFALFGSGIRIRVLGRRSLAIEGDIRSMEWEE